MKDVATYATSATHNERFCKRVDVYKQMDAYPGRIHPHYLQGAVNDTLYAKQAFDEEMMLRRMILACLMLDGDCDEHCGCKQPCEEEDSNDDKSVPLENKEESIIVSPHEQLEEDMLYFDSDDECNKSEYA